MKLNKRYIGLFLFLAAALIAMYGAYGFITNRQSSEGPSIGVVQIDDVLEFNPSYEDYKNAKAELEQLKAQYALEQEALNTKSDLQNEQLKSLSLDPTLSDALNVELQTRIATKQNQLNAQLDAKRAELVQKYMKELKVVMVLKFDHWCNSSCIKLVVISICDTVIQFFFSKRFVFIAFYF